MAKQLPLGAQLSAIFSEIAGLTSGQVAD